MGPGRIVRIVACILGLLLVPAIAGCSGKAAAGGGSWAPVPETRDGLGSLTRVEGDRLLLHTAGGYRDFVPGVNIGSTIPGTSPGELAVRAEDYRRWFPQIAGLGLRAVRVYTILPPHFYAELVRYNRAHPDSPLYLLQGVWIPEDDFYRTKDLFDGAVRDGFRSELRDVSAAVHGDLSRPTRRGVANGSWTADVSPWLLGYSIGVEWDPIATAASDAKNAGVAPFAGRFFTSRPDASPTEVWLAEMLDTIAAEEASRGVSTALTFTNWPTTDPLRHPDEPLPREDLVGIDATRIECSDAWPGGYFASFHAYPYYPDFQRHERRLGSAKRDGKPDPYVGYLRALRAHFRGMPLMVTEFGVPSSVGLAHVGPLGRDQGGHGERDAMAIDADLLRALRDEGLCGGFVFEWADEWFKFTWNTIDYELPGDRRQMWRNPWTNEEYFGLVAMDAGETRTVTVDGDGREWEGNGSQVVYEGSSGVREVRAVRDEEYLYLRIVTDASLAGRPETLAVGFDLLPGGRDVGKLVAGVPAVGRAGAVPADEGVADYAAVLGGKGGQAYVRADNDQFTLLYGRAKGYVPLPSTLESWVPQRLITNKPMTVPSTGESLPAEHAEVGRLRLGTSDPASAAFDSRTAYAKGKAVEVRLPWQQVGCADPSSLLALVVGADGSLSTRPVARVGIEVILGGKRYETAGYAWEPWQRVSWHERPKAGLDAFADAVRDVQGAREPNTSR